MKYEYKKWRYGLPPMKDWKVTDYMVNPYPVILAGLLMGLFVFFLSHKLFLSFLTFSLITSPLFYGKAWGYRNKEFRIKKFRANGQVYKNLRLCDAKDLARCTSKVDRSLLVYFSNNKARLLPAWRLKWMDSLTEEEYECYRLGEYDKSTIEAYVFMYWLRQINYE